MAQEISVDNPRIHAEVIDHSAEFVTIVHRFPQASATACINSFSGLLLKNDISITNLVDYMELSLQPEIELLAKK